MILRYVKMVTLLRSQNCVICMVYSLLDTAIILFSGFFIVCILLSGILDRYFESKVALPLSFILSLTTPFLIFIELGETTDITDILLLIAVYVVVPILVPILISLIAVWFVGWLISVNTTIERLQYSAFVGWFVSFVLVCGVNYFTYLFISLDKIYSFEWLPIRWWWVQPEWVPMEHRRGAFISDLGLETVLYAYLLLHISVLGGLFAIYIMTRLEKYRPTES